MMIHTNELEIQQTAGTSYLDCFKGVDLRRTELTVMTWVIQQTSGSAMMGWSTYFLLQVGLSGDSAYSLNIGQSAMGFVGTVASWVSHHYSVIHCLLPTFGRSVTESRLTCSSLFHTSADGPSTSGVSAQCLLSWLLLEDLAYRLSVAPLDGQSAHSCWYLPSSTI